jgi:hypothetical protein
MESTMRDAGTKALGLVARRPADDEDRVHARLNAGDDVRVHAIADHRRAPGVDLERVAPSAL